MSQRTNANIYINAETAQSLEKYVPQFKNKSQMYDVFLKIGLKSWQEVDTLSPETKQRLDIIDKIQLINQVESLKTALFSLNDIVQGNMQLIIDLGNRIESIRLATLALFNEREMKDNIFKEMAKNGKIFINKNTFLKDVEKHLK